MQFSFDTQSVDIKETLLHQKGFRVMYKDFISSED